MRTWILDMLSEAPALLALGLFLACVLVWGSLVSDMIAQSIDTEKVIKINDLTCIPHRKERTSLH